MFGFRRLRSERFLNRCLLCAGLLVGICPTVSGQAIVGVTVTPHRQSPQLRWRRDAGVELAARVELFIANDTTETLHFDRTTALTFDNASPAQLTAEELWAWHDTPGAWLEEQVSLPPGGVAVLAFNGSSRAWGVGTEHTLKLDDTPPQDFSIDQPDVWLEKVVFLREPSSTADSLEPDQIVVHLRNAGMSPVRPVRADLWLPAQPGLHQVFSPGRSFDIDTGSETIAAGEAGVVVIDAATMPLGYAVLEMVLADEQGGRQSVGARVRIKPESFDISGGWVASKRAHGNSLTDEPYLQTLIGMHINTGQIEEVAGYTDTPQLYDAYPLKRFNRLGDTARYDTDAMLPGIHAVEFIGEPQFGGGRPVPPQAVWEQLAPYQPTRLPTSVTLSEERTWFRYAGLSDFAHFDAYRVIAPAADNWRAYDRWNGQSIRWGAPLETIGDMTRSLAHHWRPAPIAIWSQGAHDGWGGPWSPRRGSPNPEELRSQAWHGLANGVHSLYWFNLSLKSLVAFPDLIAPITRVNREAKILEPLLLSASLTSHERVEARGQPDWDLTVLSAPHAAVLAAHDLAYSMDAEQSEFRFHPRSARLRFPLPAWLHEATHVFRVDADGTHEVTAEVRNGEALLSDTIHMVGVYVATRDDALRQALTARHRTLLDREAAIGFHPATSPDDLAVLTALAEDVD